MRSAFRLLITSLWCACAALSQQAEPGAEMTKAVEEFKVLTRDMGLRPDSPRKRKQNGARWKWHGRVFENLRNDLLDAVPHEIVQLGGNKSLLRRNQFGFNIGGPVVIPFLYSETRSTHFSLSYEGVRERVSRSNLTTIATAPEHGGDFSATVDQSGALLPIFDPLSTRPNPNFDPSQAVSTENLEYLREQFPGNRIPVYRLDPVAQNALSYYPKPNAAVGPFDRNNYFLVSPETNTANGMIAKVDHTLRERHRLNFDLSYSNGSLGAAELLPGPANPGANDRRFHSRRASIEHVFTSSSQTVNTLGLEATTDGSKNGSDTEADYPAELGLSGVSGPTFPYLRIYPYLSMGRSYPTSTNTRNSFSWSDSLSSRRGKHNLRLVARHSRFQVHSYWPQYPTGFLRFEPELTGLPGIVNTGHAFSSFLLGYAEYGARSIVVAPSYFRRSSTFVTMRDSYELRRGFTISGGASMSCYTPRVEKYDRQSTIDLTAINPANGRPGALVVAGQGGHARAFQPTLVKVEPNLGVAWNPRGDTKTVVRANFSRDYSVIPVYFGQFGTQAFNSTPTYISPNTQLQPALIFADGFPAPDRPVPDTRPEAANDTIADLINTTDNQPIYQSASLSLERELPGSFVLTAGLAYAGGKNLPVSENTADPNSLRLETLQYRDQLNDEEFNRSLRPYPQYKGFELNDSWPLGRYRRDAGWLRVEKRTSRGLTLNLTYQVSKQYDDYSGPTGRQDVYNRDNEWSLTWYNRPHYLGMNYVYELPFGRSLTDWRRLALEGWSLSGSSSVVSGEPLAIRPLFNNTGGVVRALRVNVVPGVDPSVANQGPDLWFNPAAFDQPADFTIGDAARTHSTLRAPTNQNHDLALNKRFLLSADRTIELSAVGLNFLNHANWNDPDQYVGPASAPNLNAGKIIGSRGGRVIQVGVRLSF